MPDDLRIRIQPEHDFNIVGGEQSYQKRNGLTITEYSPKAPTFGAPNSKYRARVAPASRGKRKKSQSADETDQTPAEKQASMTWPLAHIPVLRGTGTS